MPSALFCFSYFADSVPRFCLDHNPPIYSSYVAGMTATYHTQVFVLFFLFTFVVLGFKLRALSLLGRHSTT
jgi:hypothetical protein